MSQNILKTIAHFQVEHPFYTILILFFLTMIIWGGISQVKTVASLEQMMPKDIDEIKAFNTLRDNGMGQDMIAIVLKLDRDSVYSKGINDIRDVQVYEYISKVSDELKKQNDILQVYSYADFIPDSSFYELSKSSLGSIGSQFINSDYTATYILISSDTATEDYRMQLLSEKVKQIVGSVGLPENIEIEYTGTPIIQQRLGELINEDRVNTQWISTLFVLLVVMIIFKSFSSSLVPIIVVFTSVNWLYGTMGYTNLPISTLAGGVAAMVIGIGIDFSIHIMNKFKFERKKGKSIKSSIELAIEHTGVALIVTSLTTIAAFLIFLIGVMPEMGRFGILMSIGIFYSLVFSLFGLPALLIIEEKIIYFFKRHLRFGMEGELHLEGGESNDREICKKTC